MYLSYAFFIEWYIWKTIRCLIFDKIGCLLILSFTRIYILSEYFHNKGVTIKALWSGLYYFTIILTLLCKFVLTQYKYLNLFFEFRTYMMPKQQVWQVPLELFNGVFHSWIFSWTRNIFQFMVIKLSKR